MTATDADLDQTDPTCGQNQGHTSGETSSETAQQLPPNDEEPAFLDWDNPPPPEDEAPPDRPDAPCARKYTFELVVDLVRAQREASPSDKWYGDWDDTYLQHNALDADLLRVDRMTVDQLAHEYDQFRFHTSQHLWHCPLVTDVPDRTPPPPNLGPLDPTQTRRLRQIAAELRTPEGAREDLTHTANHALAALYEAHATLGEVLWTKDGGTWLWEDDLPAH